MPWARNLPAPPIFFASSSNTSMNSLPMVLRFSSGSVTPASAFRKVLGVHMNERDVVAVAEQRHDLLGLGEPQQAVIDEHAGELVADRFVDQHRGDRAESTPPDKPADHPPLPTCARIFVDRLVLEGAHGPVAGEQPAILRTKLRRSAAPCGVCTTSRWNCVA